jgi:hypothetical protein
LSFQVVFRRLMVGFAVPDWAGTKLNLAAWPEGARRFAGSSALASFSAGISR